MSTACAPASSGLTVDVRTDLVPGSEFASVQTEVMSSAFTSGAVMGMVQNRAALAANDFVRGQRVAELAIGPGSWYVRVSLLDALGHPLLRRTTALTLTGRYALTVVLARSCGRLTCPETGDNPMATECSGGHCVVPRCSPETPEFCPTPRCTRDADCTMGACGAGTCVGGACLVSRNASACRGGTCGVDYTCSGAPDAGSRGDVGPADSGAHDAGIDMGPRDAGSCTMRESNCTNGVDDDCDGLADCADPDCNGVACNDGNLCTHTDRCSLSARACTGTAISCVNEPCRTHVCNGTAACTDTDLPTLTPCPDDGNPCTADWCGSGTCVHWPNGDNTQYDSDYYHRCCGGSPTQLNTDANCGSCGDNCGGQGCGGVALFGWSSCNCPVSNQFCLDRSRGLCYDGAGDGVGWLCQCQNDGDCAPGQTCCMYGGPAFRHVCRFGGC